MRGVLFSPAAAGLRQSAATRWAGAGFNSAEDKRGCAEHPRWQAHSFIPPDQRRFNVPRSTRVSPTEYKLFVSCNNQLSVQESRRAVTHKSCFHILQSIKNRAREGPDRFSSQTGKIRVKDHLRYSRC